MIDATTGEFSWTPTVNDTLAISNASSPGCGFEAGGAEDEEKGGQGFAEGKKGAVCGVAGLLGGGEEFAGTALEVEVGVIAGGPAVA